MKMASRLAVLFFLLASCTNSPAGSNQPSVLATPVATMHETASTREIPAWLQNPENDVLLYVQKTTNPKNPGMYASSIIFFSPIDGKNFSIRLDLPTEAGWIDNQTIGLSRVEDSKCDSGASYESRLDLGSGEMVFKGDDVRLCVPAGPDQINVSTHGGDVSYFDGGADWVEFLPISPDLYYEYAELSPDQTTMVVLQRDSSSGDPTQISFYDFSNKRKLGSVTGRDIQIPFQFVGNDHKVVFFDVITPCVLDWDVFETVCGGALPADYRDIHLGYVNQDASRVGFVYRSLPSTDGGIYMLCLYEIFNGEIKCPTKDLDFFETYSYEIETYNGLETRIQGDSVLDYSISPDEKFAWFSYGQSYPPDSPKGHAVVGVDGESFFDLYNFTFDTDYHDGKTDLPQWRPLP